MRVLLFVCALLCSSLLQAQSEVDPWEAKINADGLLELSWENLVPTDYNPDAVFEALLQQYDLENIEDDDPKVAEIQSKMRDLMSAAPAVASLDGRRIRMPGLVLPLEADTETMRELLLVPYFGACIHVPPPPANQILYIRTKAEGVPAREFYEPVWVEGVLHVQFHANETGDAGYILDLENIETYEEEQ